METFDTLLLSRIQFAANISFHILFPTITIALGWVLFFFRLRFAQNGEGALQSKAVGWSRGGLWGVILGIAAVSVATPFVSPRIFDKWFSVPEIFYILPLPAISGALVLWLFWMLRRMPFAEDRLNWLPFAVSTGLFALSYLSMAYSFYPYVAPERLTIYEAAAAPDSLFIILVGACVVAPVIIGYTVLAYFIFRGKATELRYD
ncbi:MAG: cytochrome d ubiquinol oxidase subunit II [Alphaproteobacteria bacterium]|nr:cytochrome d ubiquinol oxidase subunit II [Alphaproteobacteria bacterium]